MVEANFLLTAAAVIAPLVAARAVVRSDRPRLISAMGAIAALVFAVAAMLTPGTPGWLAVDHLAAVPVVMVIALLLAVVSAAPARDLSPSTCARLLIALCGVLLLYTSTTTLMLLVGWTLSGIPFVFDLRRTTGHSQRWFAKPAVALIVSVALVGVATVWLWASPSDASWPFYLIVVAGLIRSGVFPFHSWVLTAFETEGLLPISWLLGARTGAFVIARLTTPAFGEPARTAMTLLGDLALFTSVLMAVLAFGEKAPRRVLALVVLSQSGFIIGGLESRTVGGITGALLQWLVVSISAVGLAVVLRCLEARYGTMIQQQFAGLGARTPRFAVLFLLFALALVGLPGTLGFCAEDLLFHGALEANPIIGLALPLATALLAIRLLTLFSNIFLGRRATLVPSVVDAMPRERWLLTALALFLVITGLLPRWMVHSRVAPAEAIASVLRTADIARR
jgi:NADH-quinone oxidoreductase subunit M